MISITYSGTAEDVNDDFPDTPTTTSSSSTTDLQNTLTDDPNSPEANQYLEQNPEAVADLSPSVTSQLPGPTIDKTADHLTDDQKHALTDNQLESIKPETLDELAGDLTSSQVQGISDEQMDKASPEAVEEMLDEMTDEQLKGLTDKQAQGLNGDDVDYVLKELDGKDEEAFVDKLSDQQVKDYVQNHPDLKDMPQSMMDRYIKDNLNPKMDIDGKDGQIDGSQLINNGLTINLDEFGKGGWDISTTPTGFDIGSTSDGNKMSIQNPLTNDTLEMTLDSGESVSVEYVEGQEFAIKLNDRFLNLEIIPDGPSRLRLYSKSDGTTLKVNNEGEYTFNDGILTYESAGYLESIDTLVDSIADIDMKTGFICMKLANMTEYFYVDKKTNESFSDLIRIDDYKLCVRKNDYIKEEYFDAILNYERVSGNLNLGYVNLPKDYSYYGSLIECRIDDDLFYRSDDLSVAIFQGTSVFINAKEPRKVVNTGHFSILEDGGSRYLRVSPQVLSKKMITQYKVDSNPLITIDGEKLLQQSPTNTVTAFVPKSPAQDAYVDLISIGGLFRFISGFGLS